MPMPAPNTPWPPEDYAPAMDAIRHDDAQLSGKLDVINERARRQYQTPQPYEARGQYNGGVVGVTSRFFLGKPQAQARGKSHLITHHLPIAEELTTALADYMAGKPPAVTLAPEDENNQQAADALSRLTESDEFASDWWNAVYRAGSLGWVFGRVVWNQAVQPHPWIEWVDADCGMAEFENGKQVAVLFWDTFTQEKETYRLLQRHTPGQIEYTLYKGSDDNLGMPVPFTDCKDTAYLADIPGLRDGTMLTTGASRPTAHMMSNYRPRQEWRQKKQLRYYSTSDVARGGTIFEDIDHNWSQLQHEVEAARGRLFVDEALLDSDGPGQGAYLDWFRDVFPTRQNPSIDAAATFEQVQFDMRVEQYLTLIDSGIRKAVSALGLSPFTVDMDPQASGDMTATETKARTKRTRATADAKGRHERAHLSLLLTAYLEMDAALNGYTPPTRPVLVSLPDQVEATETERIANVASVFNAGVLSIEAAVDTLHPEWTDEQKGMEVERIRALRRGEQPFDPLAGVDLDGVIGGAK